MKTLKAYSDRSSTYKIEAARISYLILEDAYSGLLKQLSVLEHESMRNLNETLVALKNVWQFVDNAFRFFSVFNEIKGLKHSDPRFKLAEISHKNIESARNFIQHLNSEIPDLPSETYPILGAISWRTSDKQTSHTISLGTLPPGTFFNSLAYDTEAEEYADMLVLNVGDVTLDIAKAYKTLKNAFDYLNEWLKKFDMLSDEDSVPNFMTGESFKNLRIGQRYVRAKFVVGTTEDIVSATRPIKPE